MIGPREYRGERIPWTPGATTPRYGSRVAETYPVTNGGNRYPPYLNQTPFRRFAPTNRQLEQRPKSYDLHYRNPAHGDVDFVQEGFTAAIQRLEAEQAEGGMHYPGSADVAWLINHFTDRTRLWLVRFRRRAVQARLAVQARVAELNHAWTSHLSIRRRLGPDVARMIVGPAALGLHIEGRQRHDANYTST